MCSEGKYELPWASGQEKGRKSLANKETKRRENPRLTSYFPEEYTVCHAGNFTT